MAAPQCIIMLSCTPWCLDWLCSMCKKQPFLLRVLSSDPFNFCVRWSTTRQRTGHTGRDTTRSCLIAFRSVTVARARVDERCDYILLREGGGGSVGGSSVSGGSGSPAWLEARAASGRQCAEVSRRQCCTCDPTVRRRTDRRPRSLVGLNPPGVERGEHNHRRT